MMLETNDISDWTLGRVLGERASATPDAIFLQMADGGQPVTFGQAHERALKLAAALSGLGVQRGTRVCLMASNSLTALNCWFALNLAGAIDVSINPSGRGQVLEHVINKADAELLIVERGLLEVVRESEGALPALRTVIHFEDRDVPSGPVPAFERLALMPLDGVGAAPVAGWQPPQVAGADVASVLFTSGTSGPSKGVMVNHAHALLSARLAVQNVRITAGDVIYCFHPFFHMAAKHCGILPALLAGARVVVDRGFRPEEWLGNIRRHGATVSLAHGPMLEMVWQQPARPDDADDPLTRIVCAPMPKHIATGFEKRFGVRAIEIYGMTEIGLPCWQPFDEPLRPGSSGKVQHDWYELRVADPLSGEELPTGSVGELHVRPKLREIVTPGYLGDAAATAASWAGDWFRTGDSGTADSDGWIFMLDRMTDRIRRRGENISPMDIELAAAQHPDVLDSVAIGVASGYVADDEVKLCLVMRPGRVLEPVEMLAFLASQLPHFMVPRYIEAMPELPRTPTNKVRRSELRKQGVTPATWDRKAAGLGLREVIKAISATR